MAPCQHRDLNSIAVLVGTLYTARAGVCGGQNGVIVCICTLICMVRHCVESRGVIVHQQEWLEPLHLVSKLWVSESVCQDWAEGKWAS